MVFRPFWANHHISRLRPRSQAVNSDDESGAKKKGLPADGEGLFIEFDAIVRLDAFIDNAHLTA